MEGIDCELCGEDIDYCTCLRCESCEELFIADSQKPGPALCLGCSLEKEACVLG